MLDIDKIPTNYLRDVAENLGWDGKGTDIPVEYLDKIRRMDARAFVRRYAVWHLGDGNWGDIFIRIIDAARAAEETKTR